MQLLGMRRFSGDGGAISSPNDSLFRLEAFVVRRGNGIFAIANPDCWQFLCRAKRFDLADALLESSFCVP
jgi:hypothetical protein